MSNGTYVERYTKGRADGWINAIRALNPHDPDIQIYSFRLLYSPPFFAPHNELSPYTLSTPKSYLHSHSQPHLPPHIRRQSHEHLGALASRLRDDGRHPAISVVANARMQRDIPKERDVVDGAGARGAFVAEDVRAVVARGAREDGHILDHAEDLRVRVVRKDEGEEMSGVYVLER